MVTIGDHITVKPDTFDVLDKDSKPKAIPGTVVYIHPAGRFCVLEFVVGIRKPAIIRESLQNTAWREVQHDTARDFRRIPARRCADSRANTGTTASEKTRTR